MAVPKFNAVGCAAGVVQAGRPAGVAVFASKGFAVKYFTGPTQTLFTEKT